MEKWSLAFLVSPPGSQSCLALAPALAFELIQILLRLQRAQGGNSLSTTWSSEVEGKALREEFHSLKSRMCSWCCWKNSLMQQLCSVLSRDSRHSIRSHVILALGLIPNECSVVNALSATFALKGKSLVLRNFPHPVALFFFKRSHYCRKQNPNLCVFGNLNLHLSCFTIWLPVGIFLFLELMDYQHAFLGTDNGSMEQ